MLLLKQVLSLRNDEKLRSADALDPDNTFSKLKIPCGPNTWAAHTVSVKLRLSSPNEVYDDDDDDGDRAQLSSKRVGLLTPTYHALAFYQDTNCNDSCLRI